jgi:hypothetical protein
MPAYSACDSRLGQPFLTFFQLKKSNVRKVANIGPGKAAKSSRNPAESTSRRPAKAAPLQASTSNFERI